MISVEIRGLDKLLVEVEDTIEKLEGGFTLGNPSVWEKVGKRFQDEQFENFTSSGAHLGSPWSNVGAGPAEYRATNRAVEGNMQGHYTQQSSEGPSRRPLIWTNHLWESLSGDNSDTIFRQDPFNVEMGTEVPYAVDNEEGLDGRWKRQPRPMIGDPGSSFQEPLLNLTNALEDEFIQAMDDYLPLFSGGSAVPF